MKLKDLKIIIDQTLKNNSRAEDLELVVVTGESSIGGSAFSKVKAIHEGFDWEAFRLNIYAEDTLYKSPTIISRLTKPEIKSLLKKKNPIAKVSMKGINNYIYYTEVDYHTMHFSVPIKDMRAGLFLDEVPAIDLINWLL